MFVNENYLFERTDVLLIKFICLMHYCTPEKACNIIILTERLPKNMTFKKNRKSKSRLNIKRYVSFCFFNMISPLTN